MPWLDSAGKAVTDPLLLKQLGEGAAPAAPTPGPAASGKWLDASGAEVRDPGILKQLNNAPPTSIAQRDWDQLKASGYQPPNWLDWWEQNVHIPMAAFKEQVGRAATMGLQDKAGALVPAVNNSIARIAGGAPGTSFGQDYQQELGAQRAAGQAYSAENPIVSPIATGIGAMVPFAPQQSLVPAGYVANARGAISPFRNAVTGRMATAAQAGVPAGLPTSIGSVAAAQSIPQAITQGATAGALGAFGNADDKSLAEDAKAVAGGTLLGGGTGGTLQAAAPLLSKGADALINSSLFHRLEGPGALLAGLEAYHTGDWHALAAGTAGLLGLHGLSNIPTRVWQGILPLLSYGAGSAAPGLAPPQN